MKNLMVCVKYFDGEHLTTLKMCELNFDGENISNISIFPKFYNTIKLLPNDTKLVISDVDTLKNYNKLLFKTLGEFKNYFINN